MIFKNLLACAAALRVASAYVVNNDTTCYLYPESLTHDGQPVDDSPSIIEAFETCGTNGTVHFTDNTFHINRVMNTSGLLNTEIVLEGQLEWSKNYPYWLSHSYNMWYQNQSTAWILGGENITFRGKGENGGVFNGNGQTWYDENQGNANQRGRPISLTIWNSTNVFAENLKFLQPQFWAVFITYSQNVTMRNVVVNATTNDPENASLINTDGADTWNSKDVVLENWVVQSGDDCIAAKGNTTNLLVRNITCIGTSGFTIGSIAQYPDHPDYVENVVFEESEIISPPGTHLVGAAGYIKSWQGEWHDDTLNGDAGGGGSGQVKNVTFRNIRLENSPLPIQISPCIYIMGDDTGPCDECKMKVDDVTWQNITGTSKYNLAAAIHCPTANKCHNIQLKDINLETHNRSVGLPNWGVDSQKEVYQCANVINQNTTMGGLCNAWAPPFSGAATHNFEPGS